MSEANFKNRADLEVTFLAHFPSFKVCISETASGRSDTSTFKNQLIFCVCQSIYILFLVAVCYIAIQITVRLSFILMSQIRPLLQLLTKYSDGISINISLSPTDSCIFKCSEPNLSLVIKASIKENEIATFCANLKPLNIFFF